MEFDVFRAFRLKWMHLYKMSILLHVLRDSHINVSDMLVGVNVLNIVMYSII